MTSTICSKSPPIKKCTRKYGLKGRIYIDPHLFHPNVKISKDNSTNIQVSYSEIAQKSRKY